MPFLSPLRYPGGKRKLTNFVKLIFHANELLDGEYVEPYAGGASIALALLYDGYARTVHINDLDAGIHAFWHSVLNHTDELCRLIKDTPVNIDEWNRQRVIQLSSNASPLELGFSTFFLNRTNRSGIIRGGVIGGKDQAGQWLLDARYNKANLISRIKKVARHRTRIKLYNLDALTFINSVLHQIPERSLIYLDPPYYVKGKLLLYTNYYEANDHKSVAQSVRTIRQHWLVSYDKTPEITKLYHEFRSKEYNLNYSAQARYEGKELIFFSNKIRVPDVVDLARVSDRSLRPYLL